MYEVWTRPTINWDLYCEEEATRKQAMERINEALVQERPGNIANYASATTGMTIFVIFLTCGCTIMNGCITLSRALKPFLGQFTAMIAC